MKVYEREITEQSENSLNKIIAKISRGESILDIGCSTGVLGESLKLDLGVRVVGIEYDATAAEIASKKLDKVHLLDLNKSDISEVVLEKFDTIILADILEHIYKPDRLLHQLKNYLNPNGRVLISIPNAGYVGAIINLYNDEWEYGDEGILDTTHVRFYTKKSTISLLDKCGFNAVVIDRVCKDLTETEFSDRIDSLTPDLFSWLVAKDEALTYQFILEARPKEQQTKPLIEPLSPPVGLSFLTKILTKASLEDDYKESSAIFCRGLMGEDSKLEYNIKQNQLQSFRFYFADRKSYYQIYKIDIYSEGNLLWSAKNSQVQLSNYEGMFITESFPIKVFAKNTEAFIEIQLDDPICTKNISIRVMMSAPISEHNLCFYPSVSEPVYKELLNNFQKNVLLYAESVRHNEKLLAEIERKSLDLERMEGTLAKTQEELLSKDDQIDKLKKIYNSSSWRITAPIRKIKQLFIK